MVKLNIGKQIGWSEHRSGWNYVLKMLEPLDDRSGILFDGNLDNSFGKEPSKKIRIPPYTESWIGFLHSSVSLCPFMKGFTTLDEILSSREFLQSLDHCRGIFTLSEYLAEYIGHKLKFKVEISSIKHPTETPETLFSFDRFLTDRKILHIGNWLRRITSFYSLKARGYKKIMLLNPNTVTYLVRELKYCQGPIDDNDITIMPHLGNDRYDELLAESIVFINLCDSSATNTIVECMVRHTPILVNKIQPVVEYLGKDYPFYYSSLEEAEKKIACPTLIKEAFDYLKLYPGKKELEGQHFLEIFLKSKIIHDLKN